jgi:hypothetical protein
METLADMMYRHNDEMAEFINTMRQINPEKLGLDNRCSRFLFVDEDNIVVRRQDNDKLRYYGGFEYIDESAISVVGNYVVYNKYEDESGRVESALARIFSEGE